MRQKIIAPAGGSGVDLRPKPVLHMTTRQPCAHASTCKRSVVGLLPTTTWDRTVQCVPPTPNLNPPQHYQSTEDTPPSNYCFLQHTQILHCLKDQCWASSQPLWDSGPILNAYTGSNDLRGHGKTCFNLWLLFLSFIFLPKGVKKSRMFTIFKPIWFLKDFLTEKEKKI